MLEIMIGVLILGVLATIAVPSFQTMMENTRIRTAAESVLNGLQRARGEAISRNTNVAFTLETDTSWQVCLSSCTTTPGAEIAARAGSDGSKNISLSSFASDNLSAAASVTFNNLGRIAANVDGTNQLARIDFSGTGTDSREMRVTIGVYDAGTNSYIGSSPKMCDYNLPPSNPGAC